jgi:hypothetical protein
MVMTPGLAASPVSEQMRLDLGMLARVRNMRQAAVGSRSDPAGQDSAGLAP